VSKLSVQPLSPLDGRYRTQVGDLGNYLSEAGLNKARVHVEIEWLIWLAEKDLLGTNTSLSASEKTALRALAEDFSDADVEAIAKIEATTRHDVKAIEYFIRDALERMGRLDLAELVHFACTSEDINNLSYAITVKEASCLSRSCLFAGAKRTPRWQTSKTVLFSSPRVTRSRNYANLLTLSTNLKSSRDFGLRR